MSGTERAFLDARLHQVQIAEENCRSLASKPSLTVRQVSVRADIQGSFGIGIDAGASPVQIVVEIDFKAKLHGEEKGLLAEYQGKHVGQFLVEARIGFDDWPPPHEALAPYLTMMQTFARLRAEERFAQMGYYGVSLPREVNFQGQLRPDDPSSSE